MSVPGRPMGNGIVERFMRTFKEKHIEYTEYNDFTDAFEKISFGLEVEYMTERISVFCVFTSEIYSFGVMSL